MKIKKSQLKELIKQSIAELKFKDKAAFDKYNAKHKMKPTTKVDIGGKETTAAKASGKKKPSLGTSIANKFQKQVDKYNKRAKQGKSEPPFDPDPPKKEPEMDAGGPSYANVPKGAKTSAQAKGMKKAQDLAKSGIPDDSDIEKNMMGASNKANKKMEIDVLNKKAEQGKGEIIDTEYNGQVTWDHGDADEDSFMAIDQDGETVELDYSDIIRFHNDDEDESMLKNVRESIVMEKFGRRFTVKEIRMWMKKLEENRYKKVYNSDARRVAWMVNHIGENLENMPKSMAKKWTKAQYGRERYLAKEFLKSQKQRMAEHKLRKLVRKVVIQETKRYE